MRWTKTRLALNDSHRIDICNYFHCNSFEFPVSLFSIVLADVCHCAIIKMLNKSARSCHEILPEFHRQLGHELRLFCLTFKNICKSQANRIN